MVRSSLSEPAVKDMAEPVITIGPVTDQDGQRIPFDRYAVATLLTDLIGGTYHGKYKHCRFVFVP